MKLRNLKPEDLETICSSDQELRIRQSERQRAVQIVKEILPFTFLRDEVVRQILNQ